MLNPQLLKKIKEDPGGIVGSIEYLDLSSGNLGPPELNLLTKALNGHVTFFNGVCSPITGINLSNNNLCGLNQSEEGETGHAPEYKSIVSFFKCLQNHRYIRTLALSDNILGPAGFKALCDLLETTASLHELVLSSCETTPQIVKDFATALTKNKSLAYLDMTQTSLTPEGVETLMTALCDTYRSEIKTLLLGGNNIGPDGAKRMAKALLRPPRALIALNLESNSLGDVGCKSICKVMRNNKTIQHLDLSDNNITHECGSDFASCLQKNNTLLFLSVSWNRLNVGGLLNMVPGLQYNNTLKYLNVIGNGGGPETGTALLEASLLANVSPVDLDIDSLPPRSRQEILTTDTKTAIASADENEEETYQIFPSLSPKSSRPQSAAIPPPPASPPPR